MTFGRLALNYASAHWSNVLANDEKASVSMIACKSIEYCRRVATRPVVKRQGDALFDCTINRRSRLCSGSCVGRCARNRIDFHDLRGKFGLHI